VSSAEIAKIGKNLVFGPQIWERAPNYFGGGGICKSTPLPTYWPSLVEILWLFFHLC